MSRMTSSKTKPLRLLAALAATTLLLAACNGDDADAEADDTEADDTEADEPDEADEAPEDDPEEADDAGEAAGDRPEFLTLATGSTGGTYFPLGGAMAGVWNDHIDDLRVSTQSSGASLENLRLLDAGEAELVMAVNGVAADAIAGAGEFDGDPLDFAFVGNIYGEVMQVVAGADTGIESIADMAGKRIAIGPPGSGTAVIARAMLEAEGIDPDNDIDAFSESFGDAADGLRDGQIDAVFAILALPAGAIEDVASSTDLTYISIGDDLAGRLLSEDDTLSALDVATDTYPGQDEEVVWMTNWATLYTLSDLEETVVYDLTKALYEHNDEIAAAHAVGSQIQIDTALDGRAGVPIHPGAQRYYDEVGAE